MKGRPTDRGMESGMDRKNYLQRQELSLCPKTKENEIDRKISRVLGKDNRGTKHSNLMLYFSSLEDQAKVTINLSPGWSAEMVNCLGMISLQLLSLTESDHFIFLFFINLGAPQTNDYCD